MAMTNGNSRAAVLATRLVLFAALGLLIELAPRLGWVDQLVLVPLSAMATASLVLMRDGAVWHDLLLTGLRVLLSFLAAVLTGIPAGWLLWRTPRLHRLLAPYLSSYYAVPVFAFYPVMIALFGFGSAPMILVGYLYAVIAVAESSAAGFHGIPASYHKMIRIYGMSRRKALFRVYIPGAARSVFGGLKLAASYSMIGNIASEFVLSTDGIGRRILYYFQDFDLDAMYASIGLVLGFQIVVIGLLGYLERRSAAHLDAS
jgi:NitT/TauT family transport system permease protein